MRISFSHLSRISARVNWYFLLTIVGVLILLHGTTFAAPGDSALEPIEIDTCEDLQLMQNAVRGVYFQLIADIDCAAELNYTPIENFRGELDGNNKTIRNVTITKPMNDGVGVFATMSGATVKNLRLENMSVTGGQRVGTLAGYADSINDEFDEGLVHYTYITNVFVSTTAVSSAASNAYIGGLIGHLSGSTVSQVHIDNAVVQSTASAGNGFVGGLVGVIGLETNISDVYVQGSVSSASFGGAFLGGIVANIDAWGGNSIARIVSDVDVSMTGGGASYVGGGFGFVLGASDAYTEIVILGSVTSTGAQSGAFVGYADDYYVDIGGGGWDEYDTCYPDGEEGAYLCGNGLLEDLISSGWSCDYYGEDGDDYYDCYIWVEEEPYEIINFEPSVYRQIYYSSATGQLECVNSVGEAQGHDELAIASAYTSHCTEIDVVSDPGYFFDSTNLPFSDEVWNFDTIWQENDGAPPTLRSSFDAEEGGGGGNTAPTISVGTPAQETIFTGSVPFTDVVVTTTISDADLNSTSIIVEYSLDGSVWASTTLSSVTPSEGGVDVSTGSISSIDTDMDGSVHLSITWNAAADLASDTDDTTVYLRFTPNDGTTNGDTVTSDAFAIDYAAPTAFGEIDILDITHESIHIARPNPTTTDPNLIGYAVYMNTSSNVFSGDTPEWGGGQDPNLLNGNWNGATFTTIDSPVGRLSGGLTPNTRYYLQLFAFDMYANAATTTETSTTTLAATPTNFSTTTVATSSISLSWNANSNPEGTVYTVSTTGYLATTTEASITVTGLEPSTTYTIELFASNDADVETNSISLEVTTENDNTAPTITVGTPSQRSIMVGAPPYTVVSVTTTIADVDNDMTSLVMQHSLDGDTWVSSTISSVTPSEGSVTTSSGTILEIDTDSDGSVGLTILWDAAADIADGTYDTDVYLRFIPNDGTVDGDTVTSTAFTIDFADPTAPGEIDILSVTTSSITIARPNPTSTDPNLVGYAVYMNTTTDVFSGGTLEWGGGQDPNLLNGNWNGATFTTIDSPVGRLSGGLTPNTRYYLQLFAFDMYANAATTTEISTITLAATPTNFVTTTVTTSSISFVWDANGNPSGTTYTVSSTFGPLTTTATGTSISGLMPNTTYIVDLFATNGDGIDTESVSIEVQTDVYNTAPAVLVDVFGFGRSVLSVSTTVSDADLDNTSLTIEYSLDGDTWFPITIGTVTTTGEGSVSTSTGSIEGIQTSNDGSVAVFFTWLVTSDVAADTYDASVYLRITPSDGVLSGDVVTSDPFVIDLVQPTAPGPTIITDITANSFRILRPDPIATDDSPIQYIYYINTSSPAADGYDYSSFHDLNLGVDNWNGATSTEVTVFGGGFLETALIPNTRYSLQLFVYDRYGNTTTTPEVSLYTHAEKPSSFTTSSIATSSISLTWDANGNPDGTVYVVSSTFGIVTTTDTNITLTELDPSTTYTIEFFARNYDGVDTESTVLEVTTEHLNYMPVVSEFSVTQESNSNALVTVRAGDFDAMLLPDIALRHIFYFSTTSASGPWEFTTFTGIATDVIDGSILLAKPWSVIHALGTTVGTPENPTTFSFTVNWDIASDLGTYDGPVYLLLGASDGVNDGVYVTTTVDVSMTTPSLSVVERATSTAEITVIPASGVDVAYYELTNVTTDEVATSTEATFVLSGLTPNTEYEFVARTYSSGDVASATSSVSTLVTYAVPPESLTVTDVTHNSMTFDWSDSGATLYRLFDVDDLETPIISTAGLFLSLEGFECETTYEFVLYAYNQLDEVSLTSSTASVTTGACVDEDEDDDTPPSRGGGGATLLFLRQLNVSPALSSDISTFANAIRINRDRSVLRTRRLSVMVPAYIGADTLTLSLGPASRRSVTKKIPNITRTTHFLMPSTARAGSYILYITFRTSDGREVTIEKPFTYRPLPIRVVDTAPVSVQTPATPAAIPTFTSFLSRGSQGAEVLALQQLLIRLGYFPSTITPNGVYGPTTEESVRVFQRANGIDARGYVGPGTREVLNRLR